MDRDPPTVLTRTCIIQKQEGVACRLISHDEITLRVSRNVFCSRWSALRGFKARGIAWPDVKQNVGYKHGR